MRIVYKRSLSFIGVLIIICIFIGIMYFFYDRVKNSVTDVLVDGSLSVNFIHGNEITTNGEFAFSVTNNGDTDAYYDILIDELKGYNKNLTYSLESPEANIGITDIALENDNPVLLDHIFILAGSTQNFTFTLQNNTTTTFQIKIRTDKNMEEYFYTTILKNNPIKEAKVTKPGEDIAISNEGLFEDLDDMGLTYYFRGNVENNYVSFAGLTWRIIRINGDDTVRLILNDLSSSLSNYQTAEDYEDFAKTLIVTSLQAFYDNQLKSYDSYIANSKFCVDAGYTTTDSKKTYNAYSRLITDKNPTFNCLGEKYASKIGLITADEVVYAGANSADDNKEYYLYNSDFESVWWTSTLAKSSSSTIYPFTVTIDGKLSDSTDGSLYRGLRPVINLNKKVVVTGSGTSDDPYIIIS